MKKATKILFIAFLLCIFTYVCKIDSIPKSLILYNGETLDIGEFFGISLKIEGKDCNSILASASLNEKENITNTAEVKIFDTLTVKKIDISVINETTVIPVGQVSGLKLYTNGVLVVGMSEIKSEDNQKYKPYENSGIEEGDRIVKINGQDIIDTDNLIQIVNSSNGKTLEIEYIRNEEKFTTNITPIKYADGTYKLGLWVRDSAAGIGTLTFYEPSTGNFAALGHGITDVDTGELVQISNGEFLTTKILSIIKGLKGSPRKNSRKHRKPINNRNNLQKQQPRNIWNSKQPRSNKHGLKPRNESCQKR